MKAKPIIIEMARSLFILLFLYTAISKLGKMNEYVGQIDAQPFPNELTTFLVYAIPGVEFLTVLLLVLPRTIKLGLYVSTVLMALFTGYVLLILTRSFGKIPCSCGGVIERFSWEQHLLFNIFFLGLGILSLILMKTKNDNSVKITHSSIQT